MPEQITKYPDVTLQVLKSAGAACAEGAPQKILTQCPKERFCSLPGGEMCIYGIEQIPQMTQIKLQELAEVVSSGMQRSSTADPSAASAAETIGVSTVFIAGIVLGMFWSRSRSR